VDILTPWAGEGYGARFLPRIGEVVVIDFFDGNIDGWWALRFMNAPSHKWTVNIAIKEVNDNHFTNTWYEWGRIKVRFLFTRSDDHGHDGGAGSNDNDTDSAWVDIGERCASWMRPVTNGRSILPSKKSMTTTSPIRGKKFTRSDDHGHDGGAGSNDNDTDSAWVDILTPWAGEGYGTLMRPHSST
jgi:hypothetical protein